MQTILIHTANDGQTILKTAGAMMGQSPIVAIIAVV
jgi:hypothetical protein